MAKKTTKQILELEPEDLASAYGILLKVIVDGKRHQDYERVTTLADKYYRYVTGIGLEKEMRQFHQRENDDAFEQRKKITKHIIPAVVGDVERSERVTVKGQNRQGQPIKIKAQGWFARIFQHEVDHLNGVLFVDRATRLWQPETEAEDTRQSV